jgi:4-hydroxy-2-oxoheptanedioate aldolase
MQGLLEGGAMRNPPSHQMLLRIPTWHEDPQGGQTRMSQALDAGVFTIMLPHVETAAEAAEAIGAMRYANASTANGAPKGTRPNSVGDAPSVWGVSEQQYRQTADLWPLNPNGNLANVILLESVDAVEKHRREITAVKGVSIAIPAPGDLRSAYTAAMFPNVQRGGGRGARGGGLTADQQSALTAKLEEAFAMQMATCKELNVICGITAGEQDIERRVRQGFRFIIANNMEALRIGRNAAGSLD